MKEKCKILHAPNTIKLEDRFILVKVQVTVDKLTMYIIL